MGKLTFIIALFACIHARAQVLDSLQKEIDRVTPEEEKIDLLNKRSFVWIKISIEKSEIDALEAIRRSNAIQYKKGIGDGYVNLGIGQSISGMYDKGLESFIKGLKIREQMGDITGQAKALNNIAGVFLYQKDYDKALEYSQRSLKLVSDQNDKLATGNVLLALGMIYQNKNDTTQAMRNFNLSLGVFEKLNNKEKQGEVLLEISNLMEENKKHQQALDACFRAMDLIDPADFGNNLDLFLAIGQIYAGLGNDKSAIFYFHKAISMADQHKTIQTQMSARLKLSELYQKRRTYDSALYYYQAYAKLNELTFSKEKASQLAILEKVYETEKKDQQLEVNREKIQSQNSIIIAISIVLLLGTISGFILYRYYQQKRRANIQLSELNKVVHERNEEITAQTEELMEANEEIRRINESLEEEVNYRTTKIKAQNEKLIEYAYFNAHKVRGPVARILGLVGLIKTELPLEEIRDLNNKVHFSALELDEVIKEINKKLETE